MPAFRLSELAERLGCSWSGDSDPLVEQVAPLEDASGQGLSFLANKRYKKHLASTQAAAVILRPEWRADCPVPVMLAENPYLVYARAASLLFPEPRVTGGVHPSAVVAGDVICPASTWIGPTAVISEGVVLGEGVSIGPGSVIGPHCRIGDDSRLEARVTLGSGVVLGERVRIHPGAVIGADGFGFANDQGRWVKVPQLGSVEIGDDVDIGANTCIDRGSLRNTVIGHGVKLDNLIMIAHNVEVGEHSAMAANTGISGSTKIGRYCTLAGAVGLVGHIELADRVHVTGMTMVTRSLKAAGVYSGNVPAEAGRSWQRNMVHLRHLDKLVRRVAELEARLKALSASERCD